MEDNPLPYNVEQITPKEVRLTADPTIIWSLHSSNSVTPYVTPIGYSLAGTLLTVSAVAHHQNGKDFYLLSNNSQGHYVDDCDDVVPEPIIEPEPVVEAPSGIPGGLNVPRAIQVKTYIRVDMPTYATPGLASDMRKPNDYVLRPGMYEFDELKYGMAKLKDSNYWINPTQNVVKPVVRPPQIEYVPDELDGEIEAKRNYRDFTDATGEKSERLYAVKDGGAFQIFFRNGATKTVPTYDERGDRNLIYLAGLTKVGEMGYGIATVCMDRPEPLYIGIRLGDLAEVKEKELKPKDYTTIVKAKIIKKVMDVKRK